MNLSELAVKLEWAIFPLVTTSIVCTLIVAGGIVARRRASAFSQPRPATTPLVRWSEVALWSVGMLFLLTIFQGQFQSWFTNPNTVPALLVEVEWRTKLCALACVAVLIAVAFRRPRLAGAGLALVFSFAMNPMQRADNWPAVEAAVANAPLPITFATPPGLPAVKVTANGVPLGTTPVVTSWEEMKTRTPEWVMKGEFHHQTEGGTLVWYPLSVTDFGRVAGRSKANEKAFFLRYHLGAEPLFLYSQANFQWSGFGHNRLSSGGGLINNGMRSSGQIFPFYLQPRMTLAAWGDEVQFLLHRARLMDYAVDEEWCAAFESYGEVGEFALVGLTAGDPGLQQVIDAVARRRHPEAARPLAEAEAWTQLLSLIDAAGQRGRFHFAGYDGATARILAARLTDTWLAEQTATALSERRITHGRSLGTHFLSTGRVTLLEFFPGPGEIDGHLLRTSVLQQLAVERDRALDAVAPEPDNLIETVVAPALMRSHRVGDGAERQIQGHAYEQSVVRRDWHSQPPDPHKWEDIEHVHGASVNRWLKLLGELDSPLGREFRMSHSSDFINLAEELWKHSPIPFFELDSVSFLFREHRADLPKSDKEYKTLAEWFWPSIARRQGADRHGDSREELQLRWSYLARMAPDSQPADFVKALRDLDPQWTDFQAASWLKLMPPDQALATVKALLDDIENQANTRQPRPQFRNFSQDRTGLIRAALSIDHPQVADLVAAELNANDGGINHSSLAGELHEGHVSLSVMQQLAISSRDEIRQTLAESGPYRTSPAERLLIERLSLDSSESVRGAAQKILKEWADWRARPLPRCAMPSAGG